MCTCPWTERMAIHLRYDLQNHHARCAEENLFRGDGIMEWGVKGPIIYQGGIKTHYLHSSLICHNLTLYLFRSDRTAVLFHRLCRILSYPFTDIRALLGFLRLP